MVWFHSTVVIRWDEKAGLRTGCGVRSQVIDVLEAQIKRRPAIKKVSTLTEGFARNGDATPATFVFLDSSGDQSESPKGDPGRRLHN